MGFFLSMYKVNRYVLLYRFLSLETPTELFSLSLEAIL